jgi:hypothetical protein
MKSFIREVRDVFLIILGILSAGMGLNGFLLSSRFIDGGVTVYKGQGGLGSKGVSGSEQSAW